MTTHPPLLRSDRTIINGGTFTHITQVSHTSQARDRLASAIAAGARHDSAERYDVPKCHPNTRVAVIENIMAWASRRTGPGVPMIKWLSGAAGAGKSTIVQTVAVDCAKGGKLGGSFFFKRLDPERGNAEYLISTLVYQLWEVILGARGYIDSAIESDPAFLTRSFEAQLTRLIIEPLSALAEVPTEPFLIAIDGLDECADPRVQSHIISVIADTCRNHPSLPIRFLLASRPEYHIHSLFRQLKNDSLATELSLQDASLNASADIRLFLDAKFELIRAKRDIASGWPTPSQLDRIVALSSEQFIFSSTVVAHVDSDHHHPQDRLDAILVGTQSATSEHPLAALDMLYLHIFSSIPEHHLSRAMLVLSILMHGVRWMELEPIASTIEAKFDFKPGDVEFCLRPLASLIVLTKDQNYDTVIRIAHASLADFINSQHRAGTFYLPRPQKLEFIVDGLSKAALKPCLQESGTVGFGDDSELSDFEQFGQKQMGEIVYYLKQLEHEHSFITDTFPPDEEVINPNMCFFTVLHMVDFDAIFDQSSHFSATYRFVCISFITELLRMCKLVCTYSLPEYNCIYDDELFILHRVLITI
ncbi:hypothetical protein BJ165DRAFT_657126 [Panaeolus papilionaceus]|nr:hypothetical protein BJ165DRAFT_657126 [Panaeolus papilionaceus]